MKHRFLLWVSVLAVATLCEAKLKPPLFASPDFHPALVQRIDVFVVDPQQLDGRRECKGGAQMSTEQWLGKRGYNKGSHARTRFYNDPIGLTDAMLANPSKEWLQDLSGRKYFEKSKEIPAPGEWIMVFSIDELGSRNNSVKGPGQATLSMYLYDRDQGTMLWHDQDSTKMWGGLLGNVMMKGQIKVQACQFLAQAMIRKLPKHKK